MEAEYLIHFPTLALLFKKPSGSERVQECVHALEDWGQDIRDTETHAAFCKRNNYPLYVSMRNSPSSLNETFHIHWFVLSRKHVLFFTCSSTLFDPLFKRSIHGLLYLYPFSFFSHSVIRPNLSPVRNIVFLWISTHALRSALRRIRAHPQAPPLGIRRKPLSFATLSKFFFELQLQRNQKRRSTSAPPPLD